MGFPQVISHPKDELVVGLIDFSKLVVLVTVAGGRIGRGLVLALFRTWDCRETSGRMRLL